VPCVGVGVCCVLCVCCGLCALCSVPCVRLLIAANGGRMEDKYDARQPPHPPTPVR
jgi:hypothetical protein